MKRKLGLLGPDSGVLSMVWSNWLIITEGSQLSIILNCSVWSISWRGFRSIYHVNPVREFTRCPTPKKIHASESGFGGFRHYYSHGSTTNCQYAIVTIFMSLALLQFHESWRVPSEVDWIWKNAGLARKCFKPPGISTPSEVLPKGLDQYWIKVDWLLLS